MPNRNHALEALIDRTLKAQPERNAPSSLESRVLAELARRVALPWWRKSFAHWPLLVRAAFMLASVLFVKLGVDAGLWIASGLSSPQVSEALSNEMGSVQRIGAVFSFVISLWSLLIRNIPDLWLYASLAFLGVLYATVFGVGAAAYRTLYVSKT